MEEEKVEEEELFKQKNRERLPLQAQWFENNYGGTTLDPHSMPCMVFNILYKDFCIYAISALLVRFFVSRKHLLRPLSSQGHSQKRG